MRKTKFCAADSARRDVRTPLGGEASVLNSLQNEREQLNPIRELADLYIDTSKLNVHDLRALISAKFQDSERGQ